MTRAHKYAQWVLDPANGIKTGRLIKLAAQRFINDLERDDLYFDEAEAVKLTKFGENHCCLWEGEWEGQPFKAEDWQAFAFEQMCGWFWKDTGVRRFQEVYIQISKKNAKSTTAAIITNFHLMADERIKTPKIYVTAQNENQARICVNMAGEIIKASPDLYEYVQDGEISLMNNWGLINKVVHRTKKGFIEPMSKEGTDRKSKTSGGKHGINASMGVGDEVAMAQDFASINTVKTSMASRKERLMFNITTAGYNMLGPCYTELRKIGIEVLEGVVIKDNYLPLIYEVDSPVDSDGRPIKITPKWLLENPEVWGQCNPNLGISVYPDFLKSQLEDAIAFGGTREVDTLTLNFNVWCETPEVWIPADVWAKNTHGMHVDSLLGRECYAGLEIVSGAALNCLSLVFPRIDGERHAVRCIYWMPSAAIAMQKGTNSLKRWADDGLIELCDGNVIDNDFIWSRIRDVFSLYNVESLAFNKILTNHDILQSLVRAGIKCNPISQGYSGISTPTKEFETLATAGQLEHFNNPVLAWQNISTMVNRNKEQEIRVDKSGGITSGITATINAIAQWKAVEALNMDDATITSW
jgi:phage terminase large subunit-like protein